MPVHLKFGPSGGIRTHTLRILSPPTLPLAYRGTAITLHKKLVPSRGIEPQLRDFQSLVLTSLHQNGITFHRAFTRSWTWNLRFAVLDLRRKAHKGKNKKLSPETSLTISRFYNCCMGLKIGAASRIRTYHYTVISRDLPPHQASPHYFNHLNHCIILWSGCKLSYYLKP